MDLGRLPELRFHDEPTLYLNEQVTQDEIDFICLNVGGFSSENRAGIERTLHRISAIRNRKGDIIGLTCRIGKTITGTITLFDDLLENNESILLMGPPGCGKTSRLREISQMLAGKHNKRVIIVDTSNEIGGDGDIPHASVGRARRMSVIDPSQQHKVMLEAVENHMPEVIVIDEISTMEEAMAAQTIAERGVILVATAHGKDLESIVRNPPLSLLVGDPQAVTLSDEEAKRRKTQKSVLERSKEATFSIAVEIVSHHSVVIHHQVNAAVDSILRGSSTGSSEVRHVNDQKSQKNKPDEEKLLASKNTSEEYDQVKPMLVYPYAVSHTQINAVIKAHDLPAEIVDDIDQADVVVALKDYALPGAKIKKLTEMLGLQLITIENNNFSELRKALTSLLAYPIEEFDESELEIQIGLEEAERAIHHAKAKGVGHELAPRKEKVRKAQQDLINRSGLLSELIGEGSNKRIRLGGE